MKEAALVKKIMTALREVFNGVLVWKVADRHTRGLPDLFVLWEGRVWFLEVKVPGAELSSIQMATLDGIRKAGGTVAVVTSVADALDFLKGETR